MINIDNVYKSFGKKKVLKGISLNIEKGKISGLIGANGAGKSIVLFVVGIYLNTIFFKVDYALSLTENVMLNTSLLSIFIRIIEGLLLIGLSLFVFVYKTKKHS